MSFKELVIQNRSYRRFDANYHIDKRVLLDILDTARLTASVMNRQGIRFAFCHTVELNSKVYDTLGWAALYKDWFGPIEKERPTAYIVMLRDNAIANKIHFDDGIIAQTITLAAAEKGLGCCIFQNCKWNTVFAALGIDKQRYTFSCTIALGRAIEKVELEVMENNAVQYWRDAEQVHHVPKRKLSDLIIAPIGS